MSSWTNLLYHYGSANTPGVSVKQRLKNGDGMSVAEFLYPMLQAWDWWYMFETKDIQLQIGGSDQFGNILAGVNAINYIRKTHYDPDIRQDEQEMEKPDWFRKMPMGFTVPLLKTASGEKFGKSAGNAIWLDREMTSPFDLYQVSLLQEHKKPVRLAKLMISYSFSYAQLMPMYIAISSFSLSNRLPP